MGERIHTRIVDDFSYEAADTERPIQPGLVRKIRDHIPLLKSHHNGEEESAPVPLGENSSGTLFVHEQDTISPAQLDEQTPSLQ